MKIRLFGVFSFKSHKSMDQIFIKWTLIFKGRSKSLSLAIAKGVGLGIK